MSQQLWIRFFNADLESSLEIKFTFRPTVFVKSSCQAYIHQEIIANWTHYWCSGCGSKIRGQRSRCISAVDFVRSNQIWEILWLVVRPTFQEVIPIHSHTVKLALQIDARHITTDSDYVVYLSGCVEQIRSQHVRKSDYTIKRIDFESSVHTQRRGTACLEADVVFLLV